MKQKIGPWKYPRWIDVVEALPKTATGKIQRYKLRDGANKSNVVMAGLDPAQSNSSSQRTRDVDARRDLRRA